jgi:hypothetical protein
VSFKGFAISGRAGAGKSTLAKYLVQELKRVGYHAERIGFGDELKREVFQEYGVTKDDPGGRDLLVAYGERKRLQDPLYWINPFARRVRALGHLGYIVVCDDLRFLSELGWCHAYGLETVRLEVPAHVAAARVAQPPDPLSPGECELTPYSGWVHRYEDYYGSLSLDKVAWQLTAHVRAAEPLQVEAA